MNIILFLSGMTAFKLLRPSSRAQANFILFQSTLQSPTRLGTAWNLSGQTHFHPYSTFALLAIPAPLLLAFDGPTGMAATR